MERFSVRYAPLLVLILPTLLFGRYYDTYRADYPKGAFCSAIGGACASDPDPENAFFQNPAAIGYYTKEEEGLVFDGDYNPSGNLEPGVKPSTNISESNYMAGGGFQDKKWGAAFAAQGRTTDFATSAKLYDDNNRPQSLNANVSSTCLWFNLPVAFHVDSGFAIGASIYALYYKETLGLQGAPKTNTSSIDKVPVIGFSAGAIGSLSKSIRIGTWVRSATTFFVHQELNITRFSTNLVNSEDIGLHQPWIAALGLSWMPWESEATLFADLDVIGTTFGGYERTLDTFSNITSEDNQTFRKKGRKIALEPHMGWRAPWWTGSSGKYYLGGYLENSRWSDLPYRIHGTAGLSFGFVPWSVIGKLELIAAVDFAKDYFNLQLSFR